MDIWGVVGGERFSVAIIKTFFISQLSFRTMTSISDPKDAQDWGEVQTRGPPKPECAIVLIFAVM